MNKKLKLSLYIQVNEIDGALDFAVDPFTQKKFQDGVWVFDIDHDIGRTTQVRVDLKSKQGHQSHIIIKEVRLNDQVLNNMDLWSRYVVYENTQIESTFGYMGKPGYYILKIHQNPLVHNYMAYFLSKCQR